jgi:TRAP-type mannitol/chloroaromatic compound transport system permease small subunit
MKRFFKIVENVIGWIAENGLVLSGVLILIMSLLATYGVGRRYIFHNPEPYSYEISTSMLVACVVLGVAGLQKQLRHLRVDFVANFFSKPVQDFLIYVLAPLLGLFYVVIVMWQSWDNTLYSLTMGETSQSSWEEPLWPTKMIIPVGFAMLTLSLLVHLGHGITLLYNSIRKKQSRPLSNS